MAVRSTAAPLYIAYAESHFVGKPLDSCSHIAMGRTRTKEQPLTRIVAIETFDDIARSANVDTTSRCTMLQRGILLDHKVQNLFCSIIPALIKWYFHNLFSAKIATAQREKVAELTQKRWVVGELPTTHLQAKPCDYFIATLEVYTLPFAVSKRTV